MVAFSISPLLQGGVQQQLNTKKLDDNLWDKQAWGGSAAITGLDEQREKSLQSNSKHSTGWWGQSLIKKPTAPKIPAQSCMEKEGRA